jgi:hypothetical protein
MVKQINHKEVQINQALEAQVVEAWAKDLLKDKVLLRKQSLSLRH